MFDNYVLVTGGLGFIGSHTVVSLMNNEYKVVIVDNLSNSFDKVFDNICSLLPDKKHDFFFENIDINNITELQKVFEKYTFEYVIHFAAYKNVEESIQQPLMYYGNNVGGFINILQCCQKYKCYKIVLSSSCTVYGNNESVPFVEKDIDHLDFRSLTNPYASSKYICEKIMKDLCVSDPTFNCIALRYFNPVGADKSGIIGENNKDTKPSNLMPIIVDVARDIKDKLYIFGRNFNTSDGTCVRDFIHVTDLADGHVKTLSYMKTLENGGYDIFNLGTGKGTSILQLVGTMCNVTRLPIPFKFCEPRLGDLPQAYADTTKSKQVLNFQTSKTIEDMCRDSFNYKKK